MDFVNEVLFGGRPAISLTILIALFIGILLERLPPVRRCHGLMNNTPLVIVMIPVVIKIAQAVGAPSSKLLISLSYAAIVGRSLALVGTSTNLLIDGVARKQGMAAGGRRSLDL